MTDLWLNGPYNPATLLHSPLRGNLLSSSLFPLLLLPDLIFILKKKSFVVTALVKLIMYKQLNNMKAYRKSEKNCTLCQCFASKNISQLHIFWKSSCLSWHHPLQCQKKKNSYTITRKTGRLWQPDNPSLKSEPQPASMIFAKACIAFLVIAAAVTPSHLLMLTQSNPPLVHTLAKQFRFNKTPHAQYLLRKSLSNRYLPGVRVFIASTRRTHDFIIYMWLVHNQTIPAVSLIWI